MENTGVRIRERNRDVFSNILQVDEVYCNKLNWKLLFLEGIYFDERTFEFEKQIKKSVYGIVMSLAEVKEILNHVDDLWEFLLIGQNKKTLQVQRFDEDSIVFNSSDVVIEYFDSSYWTVTSCNVDFVEKVKNALGELYKIEPVIF